MFFQRGSRRRWSELILQATLFFWIQAAEARVLMKAKPFNLKEHHTAQEHHANITGVLGKFLFEKKGTLRVGYVYIYIIYTRYISLKCTF